MAIIGFEDGEIDIAEIEQLETIFRLDPENPRVKG